MSWRLSSKQNKLIAFLLVVIAFWLTRGFELDRFVTIDESKWLVRAANFYQALSVGRFQDTFQHGHPGVTIMWAGALGYMLKIPNYPQLAPGQFNWNNFQFDEFLAEIGYSSLPMLATGRAFVVIIAALAIGAAFLFALRLLGWRSAVIGFGLIILDPFQAGLTRVLHPDSLLSIFMFLSGLAYLSYLFTGRRRIDLVVSAIAAALTWLTKTPGLYLIPLVGLFSLMEHIYHVTSAPNRSWTDYVRGKNLLRAALPLLVWIVIAVAVVFLLWPALWVSPISTLSVVFEISDDYAIQGHSSPVFYDGRIINGDPGFWFYPITWLWRTTPVVMAGLLLAAIAFALRATHTRSWQYRMTALGLVAWAFFFVIFMSMGAKKFDRYLLPAYMPLDLLAGIGWAAVLYWLPAFRTNQVRRFAAVGAVALLLVIQGMWSVRSYPYYLSHYNPVMGGSDRAPEVMFIGWGQGLDQAARYLNEKLDPAHHEDLKPVAAWYPRGPFSFIYEGVTASIRDTWESDYSVVYAHQWQRELPSRRMLQHLNSLTPEESIWINNIEYARIYNMAEADMPAYAVDYGDKIRLVFYDNFSGALYPEQKWDMTLHFVALAPVEKNLNLLVRIVKQEGDVIMRSDGWPLGTKTDNWTAGHERSVNDLKLEITDEMRPGIYRIEVSFYDPVTLDHLPVTSANTGELLPMPYLLDYLIVGDLPQTPAKPLKPVAELGEQIALLGADILDEDGEVIQDDTLSFRPGESLNLRLFWRALSYMYTDYTAFVHVIGPEGQPVFQYDQRPMGGFLPTSYWPPNQVITDDYVIELPEDAQPGEYQVVAGLYDLETMQRLPVARKGEASGDSVFVVTLPVEAPQQ